VADIALRSARRLRRDAVSFRCGPADILRAAAQHHLAPGRAEGKRITRPLIVK